MGSGQHDPVAFVISFQITNLCLAITGVFCQNFTVGVLDL